MQTKALRATVKAAGAHEGVDEGVVEAIVAAYNVDSIGDRIIPGAFKNSLDRRKEKGVPIPFVWSHKSDDPFSHIGVVEDAEEREEGLWVRARLDLDEPMAAKCFKLMKGRRITEFSFAYEEVDARPVGEKSDDGTLKELHELDLFECGPTMLGCNRQTSLVGVKNEPASPLKNATFSDVKKISDSAAELKAGRVLSKENEGLVEQIHALAAELLAAVKGDPAETSAEKATPVEPADTSDSQVAEKAAPETKSVEPAEPGTAASRIPSPDLWLLMELEADAEAY